ncbi:hypothetical protein [Herbidospora cretacea]|uniref:hypothetical protein n=1 Tax=Herbidospora cretacea TaxID=28444 RepID=UPI000A78FAC0|nr:hypothetical protein [Herbidospora cretacea]
MIPTPATSAGSDEPGTGYPARFRGEYVVTGDAEAVYLGTVERHGGRAVPAGGCRQAARDLLLPPRKDPLFVLAQEAAGTAGRDPRIADADGRWAGCMREKGYAYPRPDAAVGDPRWAVTAAVEDPPEDGGPAELATAAGDHECREESGWYDRRHEVYADHQNRVIAAGGPAMADVRAYTTELEAAAAKVLAGDYTRTW